MSRLSSLLLIVLFVACSKKAEPPPAPAETPPPTETAPAPTPTPTAAVETAPSIANAPETTIAYGEEQVKQICANVVALRDKIASCDGGAKALEPEQKSVDGLKAALDKGVPSAEMRPKVVEACQRVEQRLRTVAADLKCTL